MALLSVQQLVFVANERRILDHLDLNIEKGQIHALLGGNGTGKTTLAKLIMGSASYQPASGTIEFAGERIDELPMHERAQRGITLSWQEPARFEGLSIWSYLALGKPGVNPSDYLTAVGLTPADYLERALDKSLSGGERKRIELAAVLAMQPRLAILDEPAAGIDMLSVNEIAHVIGGLRDDGAAVLLITHREEMARIADRASYLCAGRILVSGPPEMVRQRYINRECSTCDGVVCA